MAESRPNPKQQAIDDLQAFREKYAPEYKGQDLERFNGLILALQKKIEADEYNPAEVQERFFSKDYDVLKKLAKQINVEKVTLYDAESKPDPNRSLVLSDILDHVYHRAQQNRVAGNWARACQSGPELEERLARLKAKTDEAIAKQGQGETKQDLGQDYHTPPHGIEMRDDCLKALDPIIDELLIKFPQLNLNKEFAKAFLASIAQHHDFIQLKGQFTNEQKSAEDYVKHYKDVFAGILTEAELLEIVSHIINRGTYLSLAFEQTGLKHTSLQTILINIDKDVLGVTTCPSAEQKASGTAAYTPEEVFLLSSTLVLSHFDVSSLTTKKQDPLPAPLRTAYVSALAEQKVELTIDDTEDKEAKGKKDFTDAHGVSTGQHERMMADGLEAKRAFKADMLPILQQAKEKARILALHPESKVLQDEFVDFVNKNLEVFKLGINFSGQLGFIKGIESDEAFKSMHKVFPAAAEAFRKPHTYQTNVWPKQGEVVKALADALEKAKSAELGASSTEEKQNARQKAAVLYSATIFTSAAQRGLNLLADPKYRTTLQAILKENFGMMPDEFKPELAQQYVIAYMSILMNSPGNQLIRDLNTKFENLADLRNLFDAKMKEIQAAEIRARVTVVLHTEGRHEAIAKEIAARHAAKQEPTARKAVKAKSGTGLRVSVSRPDEAKERQSTAAVLHDLAPPAASPHSRQSRSGSPLSASERGRSHSDQPLESAGFGLTVNGARGQIQSTPPASLAQHERKNSSVKAGSPKAVADASPKASYLAPVHARGGSIGRAGMESLERSPRNRDKDDRREQPTAKNATSSANGTREKGRSSGFALAAQNLGVLAAKAKPKPAVRKEPSSKEIKTSGGPSRSKGSGGQSS